MRDKKRASMPEMSRKKRLSSVSAIKRHSAVLNHRQSFRSHIPFPRSKPVPSPQPQDSPLSSQASTLSASSQASSQGSFVFNNHAAPQTAGPEDSGFSEQETVHELLKELKHSNLMHSQVDTYWKAKGRLDRAHEQVHRSSKALMAKDELVGTLMNSMLEDAVPLKAEFDKHLQAFAASRQRTNDRAQEILARLHILHQAINDGRNSLHKSLTDKDAALKDKLKQLRAAFHQQGEAFRNEMNEAGKKSTSKAKR